MAKLKGWSMECQHPSMIHVLNNAAWSDSHGAAHEPRKDRNTMNEEEDAYPAKQNCSPASVEFSAGWHQGHSATSQSIWTQTCPGVSKYHSIRNDPQLKCI